MTTPGTAAVTAIAERLVHSAGLSPRVAEHLSQTYGQRAESVVVRGVTDTRLLERMDAELPYLWVEVDHAVDVDFARTIDDVLARRIPLRLRGRDQGRGAGARTAERMAARLGWDAAETERQVARYQRTVAASRRFRQGPSIS